MCSRWRVRDSGILEAMKRTILTLIVLLLTAPASAAFLGENSRLGESFLNTSIEQVAGDVSREMPPGSGEAWLERAAECFVAPTQYPEGSFSVSNWNGYPEGVPKPQGPFRLIEGEEYQAARDAANAANRAMHQADPSLAGQGAVPGAVPGGQFRGHDTDLLTRIPIMARLAGIRFSCHQNSKSSGGVLDDYTAWQQFAPGYSGGDGWIEVGVAGDSASIDERFDWSETDVEHQQYSGGLLLDWTDATGSGHASGEAVADDGVGCRADSASTTLSSTSGGGAPEPTAPLDRGEQLRRIQPGPLRRDAQLDPARHDQRQHVLHHLALRLGSRNGDAASIAELGNANSYPNRQY